MIHDRRERIDVLTKAFGAVRPSADGINVACRCPECASSLTTLNDKRKLKLAVKLDSGIYHCWICGIRGRSIVRLIKKTAASCLIDAIRLWPINSYINDNFVTNHKIENIQLPSDFTLLANVVNDIKFKSVVSYLTKRELLINDMWRWRIGVSNENNFIDRVIIPSFDINGNLNYYTSRAASDRIYPRYINADCMKQDIIFNEIDIDWESELVLTEGVFDLITADDNAVPLLGNSLDEQFKLFNMIVSHDTPVILALDGDAYSHTQRIAKLLYSYNIDVKIMSLGTYKDLGEMPRQIYKQLRKTATRWSPKSSLLSRISNIDITRSQNLMQYL